MDATELISRYAEGERNFKGISLRGIILTTRNHPESSSISTIGVGASQINNRAQLIGADFSEADLSGAHLSLANLSKVNLSGAIAQDRTLRTYNGEDEITKKTKNASPL
ncbi:pentapeptide repeat-containing protein [Limnospira fusiformis]|uniref:pentapeptide repeat-containing protein n=1 Tax=Limnospira fusiformis TaxID=54297 RepID=UPI00296F09AA